MIDKKKVRIKPIVSLSAKSVICLAVVYYIFRTVFANWGQMSGYAWDFQPGLMTLSVGMFFVAYAYLVWVWGRVLMYTGNGVSYRDAWSIYFFGNLGRYVPGKVWAVAGTAWMADRKGLPPMKAGTASVFAQAYSIISSLVFFAVFLILKSARPNGMRLEWIVPFLLVFAAAFMIPRNLERIINRALSSLGKESVSLGLTFGKAVRIVGLYFISWVLFGIAFRFFMASFAAGFSGSLFLMIAVFAASYVGGFLAVFAPGGLGVRESLMSALLAGSVSQGTGLLAAFLVRLLVTGIELFCVSIVLVTIRKGFVYGKKETVAG